MSGQIKPSTTDVHALHPRIGEYVTIHGKGDFSDVTKALAWEDHPGLSEWVQFNPVSS